MKLRARPVTRAAARGTARTARVPLLSVSAFAPVRAATAIGWLTAECVAAGTAPAGIWNAVIPASSAAATAKRKVRIRIGVIESLLNDKVWGQALPGGLGHTDTDRCHREPPERQGAGQTSPGVAGWLGASGLAGDLGTSRSAIAVSRITSSGRMVRALPPGPGSGGLIRLNR